MRKTESSRKQKIFCFWRFERAPIGKRLLYKLADLALKEGNVEEAEDYYKEFCNLAADDPRQYILRYMILKAKGAPVEQLIHTLEQYCNAELDEKWMYELAELYNQAGMEQLCVMTCDKIMLMFGLGKYVDKAMELKLQYAPLNQYQMDLVENKEKYEAKLKAVEQEYKKGTSIVQPIENTDRRQLDREEEPVEDTAEDETVYAEDEYTEDYREEPAVTIQDDDITEEEPVSESLKKNWQKSLRRLTRQKNLKQKIMRQGSLKRKSLKRSRKRMKSRLYMKQQQRMKKSVPASMKPVRRKIWQEKCQNYLQQQRKKICRKMKWDRPERLQISVS